MTKNIASFVKFLYTDAVCIIILTYILYLTLQPIDVRITDPDIKVILGIMTLAGIVIVTCIAQYFCKGIKKTYLQINWSDIFVTLWLVYFIMRAWFWTEIPCATNVIKGLMMFMSYFTLRLFFSFYHLASKILILALLLFGGYEALLGISQLMNGGSNHALFLITGTFYNPGPYSAYLVLGAVIIISMLHSETKDMYLFEFKKTKTLYLYYGLLLLFVIVLPATWSRSAFMALAIICLWIYRDKYYRY